MANPQLTVPDMLTILRDHGGRQAWIDVRSELEFSKAAIPGFVNHPILRQRERHAVGIAYKQSGADEALRVATELVAPARDARLGQWLEAIRATPSGEGVVMCWRGGLRSRYACDWLRTVLPSSAVLQLAGGYKALRHALLQQLSACPELVVVTGLTGTGKTALLQSLPHGVLDLEAAAHHRGSAFGSWPDGEQPAQATFENTLALQILRQPPQASRLLAEDESRMIGRIFIPDPVLARIQQAPVIVVEDSVASRSARLFEDYIAAPLRQGIALATIEAQVRVGLTALRRRLDRLGMEIAPVIEGAFRRGAEAEDHEPWIAMLLTQYYDRRYHHAAARHQRQVLFSGSLVACQEWARDFLAQSQR